MTEREWKCVKEEVKEKEEYLGVVRNQGLMITSAEGCSSLRGRFLEKLEVDPGGAEAV
jgi:hypothetical protein